MNRPASSSSCSPKTKKMCRTKWNNDGPNDSISSMSVLLDWLTTHGNYARWRGGENLTGETKAVLASQIATLMTKSGIISVRNPKDIINMIGRLEHSYREAIDFLRNTGSGITNEASLKEAIMNRCPYYDTLKGVFEDRLSSRPLFTSDDLSATNSSCVGVGGGISDPRMAMLESGRMPSSSEERKESNIPEKHNISKRSARPNLSNSTLSSTRSEWSELRSTLSRTRATEQASNRQYHREKIKLKRKNLLQTITLEKRRLKCIEEESKCRVQLLQAQIKKAAQRAEMTLKVKLARNRKHLRDKGVPESEIDELLPLH